MDRKDRVRPSDLFFERDTSIGACPREERRSSAVVFLLGKFLNDKPAFSSFFLFDRHKGPEDSYFVQENPLFLQVTLY
jgi:hypothetical protein